MQESYEILKTAIEKAGVKKVAQDLNLSHSLVYKWCQKPAGEESLNPAGAVNPLDRIYQIYKVTNDDEMINWICQAAQGYFVKNPGHLALNRNAAALKDIQLIIKEFSEALEVISSSYDNDKAIDQKEAIKIRRAWDALKRVGEAFVCECEAGYFNKGKKK